MGIKKRKFGNGEKEKKQMYIFAVGGGADGVSFSIGKRGNAIHHDSPSSFVLNNTSIMFRFWLKYHNLFPLK